MLSFEPTSNAESIGSPEGTIVLWFPVVGIVAARVTGFINGRTTKAAYALIDAQPELPYEGFLDLSESSGFDWNARMYVLQWNVRQLSPQMKFHLRITPRFVVTTRVLRHLLGGRVEFHLEGASFASAYTLAIKRKARSSNSSAPPRLAF